MSHMECPKTQKGAMRVVPDARKLALLPVTILEWMHRLGMSYRDAWLKGSMSNLPPFPSSAYHKERVVKTHKWKHAATLHIPHYHSSNTPHPSPFSLQTGLARHTNHPTNF
jgi:hypothetical protein